MEGRRSVQEFLRMRTGAFGCVALMLLFCIIAPGAHAALYDGNGPGQSTIGEGGDYPSLLAACTTISAAPLTGAAWTFLILNDKLRCGRSALHVIPRSGVSDAGAARRDR